MVHTSFHGKTALVIGAGPGIGLGCAKALAEDGAAVVLMARRESALRDAKAQLLQEIPGAQVEIFPGDACNEADVKQGLAVAHQIGNRLDTVISVVGGPVFKPLLMREVDEVRQELELNFISAFLAIRHGAPLMTRGGSIVCISTIAAVQSAWGLAVYGAAKAGLERLVRGAAFELGGAGIRVNAVRPGATLPEAQAVRPEFSSMMAAYIAETPLGRRGVPEDIGRVVRFLAGPESAWVTGQTFSADGGLDQGKSPDFMDMFFDAETLARVRAGKGP